MRLVNACQCTSPHDVGHELLICSPVPPTPTGDRTYPYIRKGPERQYHHVDVDGDDISTQWRSVTRTRIFWNKLSQLMYHTNESSVTLLHHQIQNDDDLYISAPES